MLSTRCLVHSQLAAAAAHLHSTNHLHSCKCEHSHRYPPSDLTTMVWPHCHTHKATCVPVASLSWPLQLCMYMDVALVPVAMYAHTASPHYTCSWLSPSPQHHHMMATKCTQTMNQSLSSVLHQWFTIRPGRQ